MEPPGSRNELPRVALETAVLTRGLPERAGLRAVERMEAAVRAAGAAPTWIGVLDGRVEIGIEGDALTQLAASGRKLAARDVGV
ncbi:MAG: pseudouridine-5'-phosphate glycosidase, partial [Gemmatimonadota bacterium]|nr:pseudouridine-5'-phosphate glycosidase [Gemmatimonadota bacterium]